MESLELKNTTEIKLSLDWLSEGDRASTDGVSELEDRWLEIICLINRGEEKNLSRD